MGRKSLKDEVRMKKVVDMSYDTIYKALKSKTVSDTEKRRIALDICKKTAPAKLDFGEKTVDSIASLVKGYYTKKESSND